MAMLEFSLRDGFAKATGDIRARLANLPMVAPAVYQAMRHGEGGVRQQFATSTEISPMGTIPWKRTEPFGNRTPGHHTLYKTGAYEGAWTGRRPGGKTFTRETPGGVTFGIGIDGTMFPQARVFQSKTPTTIRPKKKGPRGSAMRMYLGRVFGVWISEARLARGLVIQPRRVSTNRLMLAEVKAVVRQWIRTGRAQRAA